MGEVGLEPTKPLKVPDLQSGAIATTRLSHISYLYNHKPRWTRVAVTLWSERLDSNQHWWSVYYQLLLCWRLYRLATFAYCVLASSPENDFFVLGVEAYIVHILASKRMHENATSLGHGLHYFPLVSLLPNFKKSGCLSPPLQGNATTCTHYKTRFLADLEHRSWTWGRDSNPQLPTYEDG